MDLRTLELALELALAQLASNAREVYATINRIAREERPDDDVFLVDKNQLISYLQRFLVGRSNRCGELDRPGHAGNVHDGGPGVSAGHSVMCCGIRGSA